MIQVTVKNSKTGSQYICKSARRTVKNITYNHKYHPFFKQFYHGPKGIYIDSPRYKETVSAMVYQAARINQSESN